MFDTPTAVGDGHCFVVAAGQPTDQVIALAVE
jgi:hypothetical protein